MVSDKPIVSTKLNEEKIRDYIVVKSKYKNHVSEAQKAKAWLDLTERENPEIKEMKL